MPRIWVTTHAVLRFMERIADGEVSSFEDARSILAREAKTARRVRDRDFEGGKWRYVCDSLSCEFVMTRRRDGGLALLTVLPPKNSDEAMWDREVMKWLQEWNDRKPRLKGVV